MDSQLPLPQIYTIDRGNSNTSIYRWSNEIAQRVDLNNLQDKNSNDIYVISNVTHSRHGLPEETSNTHFAFYDNQKYFCGMPVIYSGKMGIDRLLFALSVHSKMDINKKYLLIDSGTFLTVDMLDKNGHQGGLILPGLHLIRNLYTSGEQLQNHLQKVKLPQQMEYPLKNSHDAVNFSWDICLKNLYKQLIAENNIDQIYITGGDRNFQSQILNSINHPKEQIITEDNAVHSGLYMYFKYLNKRTL